MGQKIIVVRFSSALHAVDLIFSGDLANGKFEALQRLREIEYCYIFHTL
jgi:hypothetical protein